MNLTNGRHIEGYILDITDDSLLFAAGGPEAQVEPVQLPLEQIDPSKLSYWDYLHGWMDANWVEERAIWIHTQSHIPTI